MARVVESGNCLPLNGPKYSLSHDFNMLVAPPMLPRARNVNLSHHWQFLLGADQAPSLYFQSLGIGKLDATIVARRSGAQRGALEDKLRPEVFLDAPCIFPLIRFHLADGSPPQAPPLAGSLTPAPAFPGHPIQPAAATLQSLAL